MGLTSLNLVFFFYFTCLLVKVFSTNKIFVNAHQFCSIITCAMNTDYVTPNDEVPQPITSVIFIQTCRNFFIMQI